jgi:hypothetical protein
MRRLAVVRPFTGQKMCVGVIQDIGNRRRHVTTFPRFRYHWKPFQKRETHLGF